MVLSSLERNDNFLVSVSSRTHLGPGEGSHISLCLQMHAHVPLNSPLPSRVRGLLSRVHITEVTCLCLGGRPPDACPSKEAVNFRRPQVPWLLQLWQH